MKIFSFDDNNHISYTTDDVTKSLDQETLRDLNSLHECRKDEQFINKEIERNRSVLSDNNSSSLQKKVAEESISSLEKNKEELGKTIGTLVGKIKSGISQAKAEKNEIEVDSKDPVLELFCTLLNQDATGEYHGESTGKSGKIGIAVPEEKEQEFVSDLSDTVGLPANQKLIELGEKGYEIANIEKGEMQQLGEDQALVIISKDSNGTERIITFDNAQDVLAKREDAAFREEFFGQNKHTKAYSVSKQEFLSSAMRIIAANNKDEMVSSLKSSRLVYDSQAQKQRLEEGTTRNIEQPKAVEKEEKENKYGFNTKEYNNCPIHIDNVNWEQFKRLGITPADLHQRGQLKKLLSGEKTDLLLVRTLNNEGVMMTGNFKFQLTTDDVANPKLMMSGVRAKLSIPDTFHGHTFTEEEKQLLKEKGTLYKEVEIAGEKRLVYIDKQTNEICTRKTSNIVVPEQVRGKKLSPLEREELRTGKPVYIKDFESKEGKRYNAWVYINPEKNTIKLDFEHPLGEKKSKEEKNRKNNKLSV